MRFKTIAAAVLGAVLVLSSCSAQGDDSAPADTSATAVDGADLSFTGETLAGEAFDGAELAGKPAVLWFWAPWCPTCRAQAGGVSALAQKYGDDVNVVGVGGLAAPGDIEEFARTVDGPTHLVDPEGAIWRHFGVTAQSTYLVIDGDGQILADGYLDDPVLAEKVAELAG